MLVNLELAQQCRSTVAVIVKQHLCLDTPSEYAGIMLQAIWSSEQNVVF